MSRYKTILALAIPTIGGMSSQIVLNLVDTMMVGRLGDKALAAVGTASFINFLLVAFVIGLSAAVQAMVARRMGEGRKSIMAVPLNGGLIIAIVTGVPLSILFYHASFFIFRLVNNHPGVAELGGAYLQIRIVAMTAVGINFSFRGFWNGINRPGVYLFALVVIMVFNLFFNWIFIFGNLGAPALGSYGAGLASTLAVFLGSICYFVVSFSVARPFGFLVGIPDREHMYKMIRLTLPNSLQRVFFAAGFTVLFAILGQIGVAATAAANVLINVMMTAILPSMALGIVAASLVGQALGRKDEADALAWGWDVVKVSVALLTALGLPMLLAPDWILGLFLTDQHTINIARLPLQIMGVFVWVDAVGLVLLHGLLGAGAVRVATIVSVCMQWVFFLPLAYLVGPILGFGLLGIWIVQGVYRFIQAAFFVWYWKSGRWTGVVV